MSRSDFLRWSFNAQHEVLGDEEHFRRYVCENLDSMEADAGARYFVLSAIGLIQIVLLGLILWRVW